MGGLDRNSDYDRPHDRHRHGDDDARRKRGRSPDRTKGSRHHRSRSPSKHSRSYTRSRSPSMRGNKDVEDRSRGSGRDKYTKSRDRSRSPSYRHSHHEKERDKRGRDRHHVCVNRLAVQNLLLKWLTYVAFVTRVPMPVNFLFSFILPPGVVRVPTSSSACFFQYQGCRTPPESSPRLQSSQEAKG